MVGSRPDPRPGDPRAGEPVTGAVPVTVAPDARPTDPRSTAARPAEVLPPRPHRGTWSRRTPWRRASLVVAVLAWTVTGLMLLLAIGMWRNDMVIDDDPVRTTATVLTVSALSTGIEFVDNTGVSQRPPDGVLYPGGLAVGQQFVVEYASSDPTLARVAGRSAVNGLVMPLLVILATWVPAGPALWWLRVLDRRRDGDVRPRRWRRR